MRRWMMGLAVLAAAACSDSPEPGQVVVQLNGLTGARALLVLVTGPQVTIPAGTTTEGAYQIVANAVGTTDSVRIAVIAAAGQTIQPGVVARVQVPDVKGSYTAKVEDAANSSYALLPLTGVTITVSRP